MPIKIAAIVPIEDLHWLLQAESKNDLQDAVEALREARNQGTTSLEELKKEMGCL